MAGTVQNIAYPTVSQICEINHLMIEKYGGLFLPPNNISNSSSLEHVLTIIRVDLYGQMLYPTLEDKACAIAYHIIKGHVFFDGNKRTAMHTAWEFLRSNGVKVYLDSSIINLSLDIATGQKSQDDLLMWLLDHRED